MMAQPSPGRREQHKRATRTAIQQAADRLFAERGVAQTTVRDIAEAAGVTERTLFRYFASKEELFLEEAFDWVPAFQQLILARPAEEPALVAVQQALRMAMTFIVRADTASPATLYAAGSPAELATRSGAVLLLRMESDLADTIEQRLAQHPQLSKGSGAPVQRRFHAEVLARVSVAAFRSAMLTDLALRQGEELDRPSLAQLLDDAFGLLTAGPSG